MSTTGFQFPWTTQPLNDDLFEELQKKFPLTPDPASPQSPLSTGIAALERRASNRRGSPYQRQGRTESPLSDSGTLPPTTIEHGLRSTSSSPSPSRLGIIRRTAPPPLQPKITRPASELFLPTPSTNKRLTIFKLPESVPEDVVEEVIEEPTPLSPISSALNKARFSHLDVHASIRHAISNLDNSDFSSHHLRAISTPLGIASLPRASTAPPTIIHQMSSATLRSTRSLPLRNSSIRAGGSSSRGAGVRPLTALRNAGLRSSGIDKDVLADKRTNAALAKRRTDLSGIVGSPQTPLPVVAPEKRALSAIPLPWRRRRRGETMSMLIDAGFFPIKEFIYNSDGKKEIVLPARRGRPALNVKVGDLSNVPLAILGTPVDFYHRGPVSPRRRISHGKSLAPRRRFVGQRLSYLPSSPPPLSSSSSSSDTPLPLSPLTPTTPATALSALTAGASIPSPIFADLSPSMLEAIEEDADPPVSLSISSSITLSPSSLEAIPEDAILDSPSQATSDTRNSIGPGPEDSAIPAATIQQAETTIADALTIPTDPTQSTSTQLTSGAILTVSRPEANPWLRSIYIQGLIKLPTPLIVPRKNSIASLAPFQYAVDAVYQDIVPGGCRNSDGVVTEDVLDWYDEWGFAPVTFERDTFPGADDETETAIPITGTTIAPIEQQIAAQMLEQTHELPTPVMLSGSIFPMPASPGPASTDVSTTSASSPRATPSSPLFQIHTTSHTRTPSADYDINEIQITPVSAYKPSWSPPEEWSGNDIAERRRRSNEGEESRKSILSNVMSRAGETLAQWNGSTGGDGGGRMSSGKLSKAEREGSMEVILPGGKGKKLARAKRVKVFVQAVTAMEEVGRL